MASIFEFSESNGAGETVTDGITNVNFGNLDSPNLASPNNRVIAGANSFEKWFRGHFEGTWTTINNLLFWKSGGSLGTGVSIKAEVNDMYATPTDATSTVATVNVPTTSGTALTPDDPAMTGDYSGYITMQLQTTIAASPGSIGTQTFSLRWDEV